MIKQKRRRKRKIKRVFTVIFILALIVLVGYFIVTKVFTVNKVEVEGNKLYSDKQIEKSILNDEYCWNTLYVFLKYKFLDTEEVPFVEDMEVSMKIPHTIHIKVYEKGMLGYIYIPSIGQNVYFDKDGFVVETSADVIEGVPQVTGINMDSVTLYEKLPIDSDIRKALLNVGQTLKKYSLVPERIDYKDNGTLTFAYGTIEVAFGDAGNLNEKVVRMSEIMPQLSGMSGVLHLEDWSQETTDIVFEKI